MACYVTSPEREVQATLTGFEKRVCRKTDIRYRRTPAVSRRHQWQTVSLTAPPGAVNVSAEPGIR
jgi:hypothetical protein